MRTIVRRATLSLAAAAVTATSAAAQESLFPATSWGLTPIITAWHFATPVTQPTGSITDVQQVAVPLHVRAVLNGWSFDASGAGVANFLEVKSGTDTRLMTLSGLTDLKLRVSGALAEDRLLLTGAVNLPTGTTALDADQTAVLQTIGAPALSMPVGALGIGPGVTLGVVMAQEIGPWAVALGGSAEHRAEYTPVELALEGGTSQTRVTPGNAGHVTLGLDRALGEQRLSLLFVGDAYTSDNVKIRLADGTSSGSSYTLGPQITGLARLELAARAWREASMDVALRHRTQFSDAAGNKVDGSSGTYVDAGINGVRGGANGVGLIVGLNGWYHTGLSFTDALVGSAARAASGTLGLEIAGGSVVNRLILRGSYGQFNTGTVSSNAMGLSIAYMIAARREAR